MAKQAKAQEHVQYHRDGSIWARGQMLGGAPCDYWEWFRKDGTRRRSGFFEDGKKAGPWTTYDRDREVYKVTEMRPGKAG